MNGISLLTPTGDRPEAFGLCRDWMRRQTFRGPVQWIVVDDGRTQYAEGQRGEDVCSKRGWTHTYVRRDEPRVRGGSLNRNLIVGLRAVEHDLVLVIEDDDWYSAVYLDTMAELLQWHDLVGEGRARYHNVAHRRWMLCPNRGHASLCQTGFRRSLIPQVDAACRQRNPSIDLRLWRAPAKKHVFFSHGSCVGIKGMPGRGGYGIGHRPDRFNPDPNLAKLREWIGADAARYERYHSTAEPPAEPPRDCEECPKGRRRRVTRKLAAARRGLELPTWWDWVAGHKSPGKAEEADDRLWVVLGKGPTFDRRAEIDWSRYRTLGLNHVVSRQPVEVAHAIDLEVVDQVPPEAWLENCRVLLMPWRPHQGHRSHPETLGQIADRHEILGTLAQTGRLATYSLSTGHKHGAQPRPHVRVRCFSAEAAIHLLVLAGARRIGLLGVDGGAEYSEAFAELTPLTNGRRTFDDQWAGIAEICRAHDVELFQVLATV